MTTVLDGHKRNVNPYSVIQRPGSSDLILLDSVNSVFYTLQFPISKGTRLFLFLFFVFCFLGCAKVWNFSWFFSVILRFSVAESVVTRFSGNGSPGYIDGDVGSAQFNKPRSFAVDLRGNVYVADWNKKAVRKISSNGVFADCYFA